MSLTKIYQPINGELANVESVLKKSLISSRYKPVRQISGYLLSSPGKRLRPALVILSAKASLNHKPSVINHRLVNIASAIELIHAASLVHDDVIDHSKLRRNRPTINQKKGEDVAIALGDYLYSIAFELISTCDNMDVLKCISSAAKAMCEGELLQVCERDNINLLKERYLLIVKNKTAALFASSCQAGSLIFNSSRNSQKVLGEYGLNFGIAFQILDDCLDFVADAKDLGKIPGSDFKVGELTLPILNLLSCVRDKNRIISLMQKENKEQAFIKMREMFINSTAFSKTKEDIAFYIKKAKKSLKALESSSFKNSLFNLATYVEKKLEDMIYG